MALARAWRDPIFRESTITSLLNLVSPPAGSQVFRGGEQVWRPLAPTWKDPEASKLTSCLVQPAWDCHFCHCLLDLHFVIGLAALLGLRVLWPGHCHPCSLTLLPVPDSPCGLGKLVRLSGA